MWHHCCSCCYCSALRLCSGFGLGLWWWKRCCSRLLFRQIAHNSDVHTCHAPRQVCQWDILPDHCLCITMTSCYSVHWSSVAASQECLQADYLVYCIEQCCTASIAVSQPLEAAQCNATSKTVEHQTEWEQHLAAVWICARPHCLCFGVCFCLC